MLNSRAFIIVPSPMSVSEETTPFSDDVPTNSTLVRTINAFHTPLVPRIDHLASP